MTVLVHNAPLAIRHIHLPRLRLPKLAQGATRASMLTSITQAYSMAYVEPFKTREPRPAISDDADLEGRDPNW